MDKEDIQKFIAIIGIMMHHVVMLEDGLPISDQDKEGLGMSKWLLDELAHKFGIPHSEN
jgi:hypothetical protein